MIRIDGVSHRIGGAPILEDIRLELPRGGITALIGPNGAGKSTLLGLMARLEKLQQGRISFDGLDIGRTPTAELARKLAILRQENHLTARLSVEELVTFGRYPHHKGRPDAKDRERVAEAIAFLNLSDLRHRFLDSLSGGQRQRAWIAMCLAQDTDYVLLDEPLNNLDMRQAREVMMRVREAATGLGRGFVIVLHDINYAALYADRIVALKQGRVVAEGCPAEIVRPDMLARIFDMQIEVVQLAGHPVAIHQLDPAAAERRRA